MQYIYTVTHIYDVDGGFGDAIGEETLINTFLTEEEANAFVAKYSKPHVYDIPYDKLHCGELRVDKVEINRNPDDCHMWWLHDEDDESWEDDEDERQAN